MNNLQIGNGDTLADPSYQHKICNLEIVCSIAMLLLWKHITWHIKHFRASFSGSFNCEDYIASSSALDCASKTLLLFLFWYFSLVLLLYSVTRLDEFSLLHPIAYQKCFCWQRTFLVHLTSRNWILNKKIWINTLILTLWKSIRRSWKKIWTGFSSQFLKLEIIWVNWLGK